MSKVAVLNCGQPTSEKPSSYVKKSVAELLVRRLQAERIGHRVIRMLPSAGIVQAPTVYRHPVEWRPYIPEELPHVELPGLSFHPAEKNRESAALRRGLIVKANLWAAAGVEVSQAVTV